MVAVASAHENAVGIALWNRVIGLVLDQIAVDGSITQAPAAVKPPDVPRSTGKQGQNRSGMTDGYGIPIDRVLAGANRNDSPLLAPPLDRLDDLGLGPLPDTIITVRSLIRQAWTTYHWDERPNRRQLTHAYRCDP
ncbi:hypothetical protein AQJ54_41475 [Streptomyces griseorubiginosus]|uniref:Uncharacterized protein n=1 Tax=Streptomyces griseorubiginosus TaxID=67304 RepID=A0A101RMY4_9ACTN|nr:hypothetical protein AQJ54_41475 [Streptomyces griseorubiginosus]